MCEGQQQSEPTTRSLIEPIAIELPHSLKISAEACAGSGV